MVLTISAAFVAGCGTMGQSQHTSSTHTEKQQETASADIESAHSDSLAALLEPPLLLPAESPTELATVLDERPDLAQLDDLFRQSLELLAHHQIDPARDILFLLGEEAVTMIPADEDSVAAAYLSSLSRRVGLLAGVVAEEQALNVTVAIDDSLLAEAYASMRGLSLPDSLIPVSGEQARSIETDLLNVDNEQVRRWVKYFSEQSKPHFARWLSRKSAVDSLIYAELDAAGLPRELIYLSAIESGFNPRARSGVGAVGPWQFMAGTARHFKLRCDWWVDERQDYAMSSAAATTYLSQLYHQFGDWALVLAAYNAGEGRVGRAIKHAGHDNFWDLRLPAQTKNHIPKFIAAAMVGEHPERYGIEYDERPDLAFDVVDVTDATDLDLIAKCAGVTPEAVHKLNPGLIRKATPPGRQDYPVKVPRGTGRTCMNKLRTIPLNERLTWRRHTVQRGETLGAIARQFGTSVRDIAKLNEIRDVKLIHPGDRLLIPMPAALAKRASSRAAEKGYYVPPNGYQRVSYRVKTGDTLGGIARKLGVSLKHLRRVNNIHSTNLIKPGERLYAYQAPS
jgi:LysM repeat protein